MVLVAAGVLLPRTVSASPAGICRYFDAPDSDESLQMMHSCLAACLNAR